jgi:hypothetical protein
MRSLKNCKAPESKSSVPFARGTDKLSEEGRIKSPNPRVTVFALCAGDLAQSVPPPIKEREK